MTISGKTAFFAILTVLTVWLIFAERTILTPFIVAGIFAYLFNPVVNFFTRKFRLPRVVSIFTIYAVIISVLTIGGIMLSSRIILESAELRTFVNKSLSESQSQIQTLPDWLRPTVKDLFMNLRKTRALNVLSGQSLFQLFPQAISRVISFLIFLVSTFFFLKEGESFFRKVASYAPVKHKIDGELLLRKINTVLSSYLRGQIFLVFLMSLITYIFLLILGIRFSFLIAIFSGFAEIVPVVGPLTAGGVAILVALLTGTVNFGLSPLQAALIIAAGYFILRQMEDYLVIPYVMGKITKLPSFVIFFSVIAGGHIAGVLGLILAVPAAAVVRLLLQFSFNKFNENGSGK